MIQIKNLSVDFENTRAVKNVNLKIADGEILGLVGESGSGKSVTALTLMGLMPEGAHMSEGEIYLDDVLLARAGKPYDRKQFRRFQGCKMSMVFQEPMTSLNPSRRAGSQVEEVLKLHTSLGKEERREKVLALFEAVGLQNPKRVYESYPHQLSGGMRQRVMIAMAIILKPSLIVADEPTTALDAEVQTQIVALLKEINQKQKNAMLFITHDLHLARSICHRVAVMKDGCVVEEGETRKLFEHPEHSYTKMLLQAVYKQKKKTAMPDHQESPNVLEVRNLNVYYKEGNGSLFAGRKRHCAVEDASFVIREGEVLGLLGESGCGKTSLCKAILHLNQDITGEIIHTTNAPQMIFQDPYSSLNPCKTVGWLLEEPLRVKGMDKESRRKEAYEMLQKIGLGEEYYDRKPAQLSGGQRQRVSIGQALITKPGLVIADEPVSALDVTVQAQILELMESLKEELKLSYLFISHDRRVMEQMCDRILQMKAGKILGEL